MDWLPPAEELEILPVETVGLILLKRMSGRPNHDWHVDRFVGDRGEIWPYREDYRRPGAMRPVNEAWDWLYVNGLIVGHPNPRDRDSGFYTVSRKGLALAAEAEPLRLLQAGHLLAMPLHAAIKDKARLLFGSGEYEAAVLMAFRELEIRVRNTCGYPSKSLGPGMMRDAFSIDKVGPLLDRSLTEGEQRGIMELFAGAMGAFKNPPSHRTVEYGDPVIAAEQLLFADLLHRMLDGFEALKVERDGSSTS